jgi:pimeloyl-ACP methyl ester carboxylesterase
MIYQQNKLNKMFISILPVLIIIGIVITPCLRSPFADIVTNDYFLSHKSIEPSYEQYKLDPSVVIHLREVVLSGRERTAPNEGKVLLLLHGYSVPGYIAFDLNHENCSMMRFFANSGWDTFTIDYEGHGLSTDPPLMDLPSAFPEAMAPIHSDVAINDVERAFNFIGNLRGVNKVHVLGWSLGASRTAPIYTIRHPETVSKLVLFAPAYTNLGFIERHRMNANFIDTKLKVLTSSIDLDGWYKFGSKPENLVPGAFESYRNLMLASDPKSGELGGIFRIPAGRFVDLLRAKPQFDASKITVPTMVIRGDLDTYSIEEDCKLLTEQLGSETKNFVNIPNASHMIPYEKANVEFYETVKEFLEKK